MAGVLKVLVVDLDAQSNTTSYLSGSARPQYSQTVTDFFESTLTMKVFQKGLSNCIHKTNFKNLWLIPSDQSLVDIQAKLESRFKIQKLSHALKSIQEEFEFDDVIIDTPPAINFFSISGLLAADKVLIPFDCDMFSAEGLRNVVELVEEISEDHAKSLEVEGVVINQYVKNARLPKDMIENVRKEGLSILSPYIPSSIVMRESRSHFKPLIYFKPKHRLSQEFRSLAETLTE